MLLERNRYLRCSFPKPNIRDTDRNWPPIRLILRLWPQINWIRSGNIPQTRHRSPLCDLFSIYSHKRAFLSFAKTLSGRPLSVNLRGYRRSLVAPLARRRVMPSRRQRCRASGLRPHHPKDLLQHPFRRSSASRAASVGSGRTGWEPGSPSDRPKRRRAGSSAALDVIAPSFIEWILPPISLAWRVTAVAKFSA